MMSFFVEAEYAHEIIISMHSIRYKERVIRKAEKFSYKINSKGMFLQYLDPMEYTYQRRWRF